MAEIRFCTAPDGARIAYAVHGHGPPLVRVATWLTHLELDWASPVWRHWLDRLGESHTVLRYDERGCGLSGVGVDELSVETWVSDLETVIDAAGLERFVLLGVSQGAAIAVAYATRNPARMTDLVLYGGYARGRRLRGQGEEEEALIAAIRAGWASDEPAYRHLFSMLFLPHGTPEQMSWYDELLRTSTTAEAAVGLFRARGTVDVVDAARGVRVRTLVVHAREDRVVPVEEGRLLASLIPGARLVVLDSANHILLADEPGWEEFLSELRDFLGTSAAPAGPRALDGLSPRELEVLGLVAAGLTNDAIAERLFLSVRTVERHLSTIYVKLRLSGKAARAAAAVSYFEARPTSDRHAR
ncbi:MAG TPA: alpha/beta fold hydrolase [Solirubrobacteraceae bacterium]|nr:alpha/beta fold hydrolase [Solirubrobacteraceae bacterium]